VIFIPPITTAFGLVKLSNEMYLIALALALVPILVLEMAKATGLVRHQYQ
jgi:Ca2+-transporting ATPase